MLKYFLPQEVLQEGQTVARACDQQAATLQPGSLLLQLPAPAPTWGGPTGRLHGQHGPV